VESGAVRVENKSFFNCRKAVTKASSQPFRRRITIFNVLIVQQMGDLDKKKKAALRPNQNQPKEPPADGSMVCGLPISKRFPVQTHRYVCMYLCMCVCVCVQRWKSCGPFCQWAWLEGANGLSGGVGWGQVFCCCCVSPHNNKRKKKRGKKKSAYKSLLSSCLWRRKHSSRRWWLRRLWASI
jgi:hypothetical protein